MLLGFILSRKQFKLNFSLKTSLHYGNDDENVSYENQTKKDFKDGVHDGLMVGVRDEDNYTHDYKEGYDFGVGLHTEIEEMQEKESQQ